MVLDVVPDYYRHLLDQEIDGAFVGGTTGEGASLSVSERLELTETWISARSGGQGLRIIVHAGHESLREARQIASHAEQLGADAVAAVAPSFFTPTSLEAAVDHAARIAEAAGDTPFYYYHLPSVTGMHLSMVRFLEMAGGRIPNLVGLKFTHSDLGEYFDCQREFGERFDILFGRDELLLAGLVMGARGAVGSTYNFAGRMYRRLVTAFMEGRLEEARHLQERSRRMIDVLLAVGGLAGLKAAMLAAGVDCGPCRPPLPLLDPKQIAVVQESLIARGVVAESRPRVLQDGMLPAA